MAFYSLEHTQQSQHAPSFVSVLGRLPGRIVASWQRHQAERALEGLSYDTLKDIGFPSVHGINSASHAR
ncbi:hypothetical protein [Pararhizobium gei]|uniref:hypothetical protein n=1 Tax=Pararhizobium gei TaxID=1395951 RepID=UPI0023DC703B|nr:hypothetical protein [Rhizobium gei]